MPLHPSEKYSGGLTCFTRSAPINNIFYHEVVIPFQVYKGRGLELAENHILYTLGHQSLLLKDHYTAASLFNELVATTTNHEPRTMNPLQQMCHLREFFIVHHMREKEDRAAASITIPFFEPQSSLLDLTGEQRPYEILCPQVKGSSWQDLERVVVETIHGAENVHLNQTCQNLFGPLSHNLMMPEVAVGEAIRLILPVTSPFQTPLLMKKLRLIWKFTPETEGSTPDTEVGEKSLYSNNDAEAAACVQDAPLENVKVEKDHPLVIDLVLTPLKPGEIFIHGIEYSLKAVFPQSESTDYTIKGKQPLKVQGPRLNSSKEHKTNKTPLYTKDTRLSCKVVSKQPLLKVNLTLPETMHQGEIMTLDLHIENAGNAPLSNLHLVHHSPGSFSFPASQKDRKQTLFDFPLITASPKLDALGAELEDGACMDILPVPLEQDLEAGGSIKRKLWICAPANLGNQDLNIHFSYSLPFNIEKKPLVRLLRKNLSTKVLPALSIKANHINACMYDDDRSQGLLVHLKNSSLEAKGHSIDPAYIRQISLISESKVLTQIVSSNENASVPQGETSVIGLMASKAKQDQNGFNFSTLQVAKNEEVAQLDVAPHVNFLKGAFEFPLKQGPQLKGDVLVALWRSPGGRSGMIHTLVNTGEDVEASADHIDGHDAFSTTESIELPPIPITKKPGKIQIVMPNKNVKHDFDQNPICLVPFQVEVENIEDTQAVFLYKTENRDFYIHTGRFLGCTRASIPIEGGSKRLLNFHVAVSASGLYSYGGLSFQMTQPGQECDDDEYIPLEVNFIVE